MKPATNPAAPRLIYGTAWKDAATTHLVLQAVRAGFRAIDTANQPRHYNEPLVGLALATLANEGIGRDQLYLQTKFTPPGGQDERIPYDPEAAPREQVAASLASSLKNLGTSRLDAFLLHGPSQADGLAPYDLEVWGAMEEAQREGTVGRIGVSNVNAGQLAELCAAAEIPPAIVQNRCYGDRHWDQEVRALCLREGIVYQGFSLLTANPRVLASLPVVAAATRLGLTPAQVVLRFALELGMTALTGTADPHHMEQDLMILDVELDEEEIETIATAG